MKCRTHSLVALLASTAAVPVAYATDYYASTDGTGTSCTEDSPCPLNTAVGKAAAGNTVYVHGGTYSGSLSVSASGSAGSYATIAAYPGELPIINGGIGVRGTYVRLDGLAAINGATGIGNGWTGGGTTNSNGHLQFVNCIADMNTMNGIAFRSATGVLISQCIAAHNGSSTSQSWSSGVDLFGAQGTYQDNIVERSVAFENVDMQVHSDGSGFIVDDIGTGATFINNIGFRNGGSCIRLTTSTNTHIINNTCYHDGLDTQASGPSNPGEIFFSSSVTTQGATLVNNLAAAAGWNNTQSAFVNSGSMAIQPYNFGVNSDAATPFFTDPAGANPDFRLVAGSTDVIDAGTTTEAPAEDIGFDPLCITKAAPSGSGVQSWWIYSIDYDYIESIGGISRCFNPKARSGAPDIGAYEFGATEPVATGGTGDGGDAGATAPSTGGTSTLPGTGGTSTLPGTGGTSTLPGTGGTSTLPGTGGTSTLPGTGGTSTLPGTGGTVTGGSGIGGTAGPGTGGASSSGTAATTGPTGDSSTGAGGAGSTDPQDNVGEDDTGCGCSVPAQDSPANGFWGLLLVAGALLWRRIPSRSRGASSR